MRHTLTLDVLQAERPVHRLLPTAAQLKAQLACASEQQKGLVLASTAFRDLSSTPVSAKEVEALESVWIFAHVCLPPSTLHGEG